MSKKEYQLPKPEFPDLGMPEPPKTSVPENVSRESCDGEIYEPVKKDNDHIPEPAPGTSRIMIGIPVLTFSYEFVTGFLNLWTEICNHALKYNLQVGYQFMYRKPVNIAEIQLAEIALFNKCTHILWMDDDIYGVGMTDLLKLLHADKDVIGGVMYASKFPYAMCVFRRYMPEDRKVIDQPSDNRMYRLYEIPCLCQNEKCKMPLSHWDAKFCPLCGTTQDNLIQKADLIPFAFTLMKTSIFAKIKRPWFHCTEKYPSDSWFADRCIEAGIQQYAHMGVRLNHNGVNDITKPFYMQMGLAERRAKNYGLVEMTPEEMEKHEYMLHQKMTEAEGKLRETPVMVGVANKEESNDSTKGNSPTVAKEEERPALSGTTSNPS